MNISERIKKYLSPAELFAPINEVDDFGGVSDEFEKVTDFDIVVSGPRAREMTEGANLIYSTHRGYTDFDEVYEGYRIYYEGRVFDVIYVNDVMQRGDLYQLELKEVIF